VLDRLWDARKDVDAKTSSFTAKEKTPTYGDGKSGIVETTALAAWAMLQAPSAPMGRVDRAVAYLLSAKDTFGNWYSTQATILSLKALLAFGQKAGKHGRGNIAVLVDGKPAGTLHVEPDSEGLQSLDLPAATAPGAHQIRVQYDGTGALAYQLVGRWWEPKHTATPGALTVAAKVDRSQIESGGALIEEVRASSEEAVDMPIVTAGLPPGFDVDPEELDQLVSSRAVEKVQHLPQGLVLYLTRLEAKKPFAVKLHLRARFPERVQLPAPTVYEYYQPERKAVGAPLAIEVG
jgi:uncharacterized protein YfaS (alpha-2-macroglobulin family)